MSASFHSVTCSASNVSLPYKFLGATHRNAKIKSSQIFVGKVDASNALCDMDYPRNTVGYVLYYDCDGESVHNKKIADLREKHKTIVSKMRESVISIVNKAKAYKTRSCTHCGEKLDMHIYSPVFNAILRSVDGDILTGRNLVCYRCQNAAGAPITKAQAEQLSTMSEKRELLATLIDKEVTLECAKMHQRGELKTRAYIGGWFSNPPDDDDDDDYDDDCGDGGNDDDHDYE